MHASETRRTFLAQVATVALLRQGSARAQPAGDPQDGLKTKVPLDRLLAPLQEVITAAMAKHHVPGLSVALIRDAQFAWTKGFGVKDRETAEPVDDATVFEAASLTKPALAYAALALCEQERLELDQPLAGILPKPFTDEQPERLAQVTARHVLTHTAGLPNWRVPGRPLKFLRPPGQKFSYSGEGFVYLQRVVEQLTGEPLDALLSARLFGPLQMTSASLTWRHEYERTLARGYPPRGTGRGMFRKWSEPNAASSLVCTAADYARFACALLGRPQAAGQLLPLREVGQMWKPQVAAADGISWGLGMGVEHTPAGDAFWHWGNNAACYTCLVVAFPSQQVGLVVMTNSGNGLKACADIVPAALGGTHPALRWRMVV